jgi:hypothetical protein
MSSSKYIKIQSQQNANFTDANNRLDFIVPASAGKVNLRDSFVQLYCEMTSDSAGLAPVTLQWTTEPTVKFNNVALVKNADVKSVNLGHIEAGRRVDVLKNALADITRTSDQVECANYLDASPMMSSVDAQVFSIFQQYNKSGTQYSTQAQNVPIEIRLGDILDFFNNGVVDMARMGDMRIHLELNLDKVRGNFYDISAVFANNNNRLLNLAGDPAGQIWNSSTTTCVFTSLKHSPYYVGMPITVTYTSSTLGAGRTFNSVITSIVYNDAGTLNISWANDQAIAANEALTEIVVTYTVPGNASATFYMAELVLKEDNSPPVNAVSFHQFNTYELNGNNLTNYNHVLEIEGDAVAGLILPVDATNGLQAKLDTLTNWRLFLNNINLTDREEFTASSLSTDRLVKTLDTIRHPSRNLNRPLYSTDSPFQMYNANTQMILASPLFPTEGRKNFQITITSNGLNSFIVYTAVPKSFKL